MNKLHKDQPDQRRRRFIGGLAAAAIPGSFLIPRYARGARKHKLRILQWNHFVPAFDAWFDNQFVKEWGEANDTDVTVDRVGMTSLSSRARAEVAAGRGHDLFMFLSPPPVFEDQVIDHREVYEECSHRFGKPLDLSVRSTFNPVTGRYYGFSESYVPDLVNYRTDLWGEIGVTPNTWDDIRRGGAEIYRQRKIPVGLGLASELDSNMALRSVLLCFGASVQNAEGRLVLDSQATRAAVDYVTALYREAMTEEVITWDPSSNNRMMLAGHGSLALNAISITRTGETQKIPVADRIGLAKPLGGPAARLGLMHLMHVYCIWRFAQNQEGAKRFLVDYVARFREAFIASRFYNLPCFPATVPDLGQLIAGDTTATPPDKYGLLADAADWTVALGHPGYANAAVDEIFNSWIISRMFAEVARGRMTTDEAVKAAVAKAHEVFSKWRIKGKV